MAGKLICSEDFDRIGLKTLRRAAARGQGTRLEPDQVVATLEVIDRGFQLECEHGDLKGVFVEVEGPKDLLEAAPDANQS